MREVIVISIVFILSFSVYAQIPSSSPVNVISTQDMLDDIRDALNKKDTASLSKYKPVYDVLQHFVELEGEALAKYKSDKLDYINALKSKHEEIKSKILEINPSIEFTGDLYIVANGFFIRTNSLDGGNLDLIERMDGVKDIYADDFALTNLFDVTGIIGAEDTWLLPDNSGNECIDGENCITGKGIKIALIDTGVDYTHPDFADDLGICTTERFLNKQCKKIADGYDFGDDDSDPMDSTPHGTYVAGAIIANGLLRGVAPDATLYAYKVTSQITIRELQSVNVQVMSNIIKALEKVSDLNGDNIPSDDRADYVDIASISLGAVSDPNNLVSKAASNAVARGIVVVAAIGNLGARLFSSTISPGDEEDVIGVGASCKADNPGDPNFGSGACYGGFSDSLNPLFREKIGPLWRFSSSGPSSLGTLKPDILAPGYEVCTTGIIQTHGFISGLCFPDKNNYVKVSGTSISAGIVAGAAALLKQKYPEWNPYQIKYTLKGNARNIGLARIYQGDGRVDIFAAIQNENSYPRATLYAFDDLFVEDIININGIATDYPASDFDRWELEYSEGFDDGNAIMNWISITSSNLPKEGILSTFDTSLIRGGKFTVRLKVRDKLGQESIDEILLFKKPDWNGNWPQRVITDTGFKSIAPVFGDINGDGRNEIIAGIQSDTDAKLYVFDVNGELFEADGAQWPKTLLPGEGSTPTLGDVDGDGKLDIIYTGVPWLNGRQNIYAWNYKGEQLFRIQHRHPAFLVGIDNYQANDVDNDGKDEIIYTDIMGNFIYKSDTSKINGPWESISNTNGNFRAVDINNDNNKEIFLFTGKNELFVWNNKGEELFKQSFEIGNKEPFTVGNYMLFANLDNDPQLEIILIYKFDDSSSRLTILDGKEFFTQYTKIIFSIILTSPVVGDINNNDEPEIIFLETSGRLNILTGNGVQVISPPISTLDIYRNLIISNADDDGFPEIMMRDDYSLGIFYFKNGKKYNLLTWVEPSLNNAGMTWAGDGFIIEDVNNDGKNDFLSTLYPSRNPSDIEFSLFDYHNTYVVSQNLDVPSDNNQWVMMEFDATRSNAYIFKFIRGDVNSDRIVDISDAVFILEWLFLGREGPKCKDRADANDDGIVDISDPVYILLHLFGGQNPPPIPYPNEGIDPTPDELKC